MLVFYDLLGHGVSLIISCLVVNAQLDPHYHSRPKCLSILLSKEVLLVLLAEEMLDLVAQAFLVLLVLFLGGGSAVASVLLLVDVTFAAALRLCN